MQVKTGLQKAIGPGKSYLLNSILTGEVPGKRKIFKNCQWQTLAYKMAFFPYIIIGGFFGVNFETT